MNSFYRSIFSCKNLSAAVRRIHQNKSLSKASRKTLKKLAGKYYSEMEQFVGVETAENVKQIKMKEMQQKVQSLGWLFRGDKCLKFACIYALTDKNQHTHNYREKLQRMNEEELNELLWRCLTKFLVYLIALTK